MKKYEVLKNLGGGSQGNCILANDLKENKKVAIKQIPIAHISDKEMKDAYNESHVLLALRHPYIIGYRESFAFDGYLNIVMEYGGGGDLSCVIDEFRDRRQLIPEALVLRWFCQITLALQYCHSRKVLHRDLKTENVFLTAADNVAERDVKLGDFGIAKQLECTGDFATTVVGTPSNLSPELIENHPYDVKSDMWALGCVLYELCTLTKPFKATNMAELVLKIINSNLKPIPTIYSEGVQDLIRGLLEHDPQRRYGVPEVLSKKCVEPYRQSLSGLPIRKPTPAPDQRATPSPAPPEAGRLSDVAHSERAPEVEIGSWIEKMIAEATRIQSAVRAMGVCKYENNTDWAKDCVPLFPKAQPNKPRKQRKKRAAESPPRDIAYPIPEAIPLPDPAVEESDHTIESNHLSVTSVVPDTDDTPPHYNELMFGPRGDYRRQEAEAIIANEGAERGQRVPQNQKEMNNKKQHINPKPEGMRIRAIGGQKKKESKPVDMRMVHQLELDKKKERIREEKESKKRKKEEREKEAEDFRKGNADQRKFFQQQRKIIVSNWGRIQDARDLHENGLHPGGQSPNERKLMRSWSQDDFLSALQEVDFPFEDGKKNNKIPIQNAKLDFFIPEDQFRLPPIDNRLRPPKTS